MTESEVLLELKVFIELRPSHVAAAKALGLSSGYLSDIRNGRRPIPDVVLNALGFERVVTYQEVTPSNAAGSPAKRTKRGKSAHKLGSTRNTAPRAA